MLQISLSPCKEDNSFVIRDPVDVQTKKSPTSYKIHWYPEPIHHVRTMRLRNDLKFTFTSNKSKVGRNSWHNLFQKLQFKLFYL